MGRKSKLTPELQNSICKIIADGNYASTACAAVGLSEKSYYQWLDLAESGGIYSAFSEAIKEAEAKAKQYLLNLVTVAAAKPQHWPAAMTILERRWPEEWGRIDRIQSIQKVEGVINVIHHIPRPIPQIGGNNAVQGQIDEVPEAETP